MAYEAKVKNGQVELYEGNSRRRSFYVQSGEAVEAAVLGDIVVVKTSRDKLEIFGTDGNYKKDVRL